jgi:hypothetical protein
MKTIYDLLNLISEELKLSEGMVHKYTFDINLKHGWVSMHSHDEIGTYLDNEFGEEKINEKIIFSLKSISTKGELQEAYWAIYNNGRSRKKG